MPLYIQLCSGTSFLLTTQLETWCLSVRSGDRSWFFSPVATSSCVVSKKLVYYIIYIYIYMYNNNLLYMLVYVSLE